MEEVLLAVGAAYVALTVLGAIAPDTRVGQWCRRVAADLRGTPK